MSARMIFYASRNADGLIHVTNTVAGLVGQHHVHDDESWAEWLAGDPSHSIGSVIPDDIVWLEDVKDCECGSPIWRRRR